jgi:short-subunit dehydrogenase
MVLAGDGAYSATKSAVNTLSAVFRAELADDGIAVSLPLPSMTATEFGDNMFQLGVEPWPGAVVHRPVRISRKGQPDTGRQPPMTDKISQPPMPPLDP